MDEKKGLSEAKTIYCTECGTKMSNKAKACPQCGAEVIKTEVKKDDAINVIALIASFFVPGLGHGIKGHWLKSVGIFCLFFIGLLLFVIPGVIIWLYGMYDAYRIDFKKKLW